MNTYDYPSKNADRYMAFKINGQWKFMFANAYTSHWAMAEEAQNDSQENITEMFGGFYCLAMANAAHSIKRSFRHNELEEKHCNETLTDEEEDEFYDTKHTGNTVLMLFGISSSYEFSKESFTEATDSLRAKLGKSNKRLLIIDEMNNAYL